MVNVTDVLSLYSDCTLCPNNCHCNRLEGRKGICGQTSDVKVAWSGLHRGEEPPVSGENGSGMIFFCGCPLHCAYCQNHQISSLDAAGITVSIDELSRMMLSLQEMGAATLNLVTGTHFVPSIIIALEKARESGLTLPVVWNSSGYEAVSTMRLIDSYIDLYLLDIKTLSETCAGIFCGRKEYAKAVLPVASFLKKRRPFTDVDALKGTLVRHLVFPGQFDATLEFLSFYAQNLKDCSRLSLMVQFVPPLENPGFKPVSKKQYQKLLDVIDEYSIDGFVQELDDNEYLWIPDFNRNNPFPEGFAQPLEYFIELKRKRGCP